MGLFSGKPAAVALAQSRDKVLALVQDKIDSRTEATINKLTANSTASILAEIAAQPALTQEKIALCHIEHATYRDKSWPVTMFIFSFVTAITMHYVCKFVYGVWEMFGHPIIGFAQFTDDTFFWWLLASLPIGYVFHLRCSGYAATAARNELIANAAADATSETAQQTKSVNSMGEYPPATASDDTALHNFSGLHLGISTAFLAQRLPDRQQMFDQGANIELCPEDACKNLIGFGGIGSGKTTRYISPILAQLLQQDCSALVFDMKGDFRRELDHIAKMCGRSYKVVGDGGMTLNLFRGTTPEVAASYLKSCFIMAGAMSGNGAFFVDSAVNYCRQLLTLLLLTKGDYSISGLQRILASPKLRDAALVKLGELEGAGELSERNLRLGVACAEYLENVVGGWDDKLRGDIISTCDQILNPFSHPDLVDAFSVPTTEGEADLTDLINKGDIFLVNLPRSKFGDQGARIAYMMIKLRFMSMMSTRRQNLEWNQSRYVAFFCDEYQIIVDSISDEFWATSRSSKTIGIVSMQGVSSLVKAVGDAQTADSILQNFRQRVIFRTEDQATIEMAQKLLGSIDVIHRSVSDSVSESYSGESYNSSNSSSTSDSLNRQQLFDASDFRALDAQYALFIGNIGDKAVDEVVQLDPLYVP